MASVCPTECLSRFYWLDPQIVTVSGRPPLFHSSEASDPSTNHNVNKRPSLSHSHASEVSDLLTNRAPSPRCATETDYASKGKDAEEISKEIFEDGILHFAGISEHKGISPVATFRR